MAPERDPVSGQFVGDDGQVQGGTQDTQTPPQMVQVTVDGEKLTVPLAEAAQGYQRTAVWTKRMQTVAERERQLTEREAALGSGLRPGFGAAPQYPASGGIGVWSPAASGYAAVGPEQPYGGTIPQGPQFPADVSDDDYVTGANFKTTVARMRFEQAQRDAALEDVRRTNMALTHRMMEQDAVAELRGRYGDFDESMVEQNIYQLAPWEQQRLAMMPKSVRLEMAYLRLKSNAAKPAANVQGAGQTTTTPTGAQLPFSEGERGQGAPVPKTPQQLSGPDSTDRAMAVNFAKGMLPHIPVIKNE